MKRVVKCEIIEFSLSITNFPVKGVEVEIKLKINHLSLNLLPRNLQVLVSSTQTVDWIFPVLDRPCSRLVNYHQCAIEYQWKGLSWTCVALLFNESCFEMRIRTCCFFHLTWILVTTAITKQNIFRSHLSLKILLTVEGGKLNLDALFPRKSGQTSCNALILIAVAEWKEL